MNVPEETLPVPLSALAGRECRADQRRACAPSAFAPQSTTAGVSAPRTAAPKGTSSLTLPQSLGIHSSLPFFRAFARAAVAAIRRNVGWVAKPRLTFNGEAAKDPSREGSSLAS